jgi:hypothetical protein
MPLHENLILSSSLLAQQYILLQRQIILSLVVSTLNNPGVRLSYLARVKGFPST